MARRGFGATPWRLFCTVVAVSVVLPAIGRWWASWLAHGAVERRVTAGNAATARAVSAQLSRQYADRIAIADDLLVLLSNGASFKSGMADAVRLNTPFCRVSFLASDGTALSSIPLATCARRSVSAAELAGPATRHSLSPSLVNGVAVGTVLERLNSTEQAAVGAPVTWLQVQFRVSDLFTPVSVGRTGSYAVVDRHSGLIVAAAISGTVGRHIKAPGGLRLLAGGRAGVAQSYAPLMHTHIQMAYQPVDGTPFGLFITLPTSEAFAQANHLRNDMLLALAVLAGLGIAAAGAVAFVVARRNGQVAASVDQLHELATRDALTGLANRGEASRLLQQHLALVSRGRLDGVGLIFVDVDRFKSLNDTLGHVGADHVLCAIADAMREQLRPSDVLARFGGDEFVVIAPGLASPAAATTLADRLRLAVASAEVTDESTGDLVPQVTVSLGVAISGSESTVDSLLNEADQAMYLAKRGGGNTVVTSANTLIAAASSHA